MKTHETTHILPASWNLYLLDGDDSDLSVNDRTEADRWLECHHTEMPVRASEPHYIGCPVKPGYYREYVYSYPV